MSRFYINPKMLRHTKEMLAEYKSNHADALTPMADAFGVVQRKNEEFAYPDVNADNDMRRFLRAARLLKWNVCKTKNRVYENGVLVWEFSESEDDGNVQVGTEEEQL